MKIQHHPHLLRRLRHWLRPRLQPQLWLLRQQQITNKTWFLELAAQFQKTFATKANHLFAIGKISKKCFLHPRDGAVVNVKTFCTYRASHVAGYQACPTWCDYLLCEFVVFIGPKIVLWIITIFEPIKCLKFIELCKADCSHDKLGILQDFSTNDKSRTNAICWTIKRNKLMCILFI